MNLPALLEMMAGKSAMRMLGAREGTRETRTVDLDSALAAKENAWMAAQQAKAHIEEQLRGISTHILRLEGAMTQLKELGAKPTGRLGSNDTAIAAHHAANEVLETEPAPPPEPEPAPDPEAP